MFPLYGRQYQLTKIGLLRASLPQSLSRTPLNLRPGLPIVVLANTKHLGAVEAAAYIPKAVVVMGAARRSALLEAGVAKSWVFLECGVDIRADDEIGSSELMQKLDALLWARFFPSLPYGAATMAGQQTPFIREVYPFEDYFVFDWRGEKYRQGYAIDPAKKEVRLAGPQVPVEQKFVNAQGSNSTIMPFAQTGIRSIPGWTPGNSQSVSMGAPNSELVISLIRNFSNINEAADKYVAATRTGLYRPMRPSFYPVPLKDEGQWGVGAATPLTARGISPVDFAHWAGGLKASEFRAGGPGSGRHPGLGTVGYQAKKKGYEPGYANATGNLQLYKHGNGNKIWHDESNDNWTHKSDAGINRGNGSAELSNFFKTAKGLKLGGGSARERAYSDLGMKKVKGALGGTYYE